MKKNVVKTETETETKKASIAETLAENAIALCRAQGEIASGTITWILALSKLNRLDLTEVLDRWVVRLNHDYKTQNVGFLALKGNAWLTHGIMTRTLYDAYATVARVLDANAVYLMKGLTEYWQRELLSLLVTWIPAKTGDMPPNLVKATTLINGVLHRRDARSEVNDKGWVTTEDVFRGLGAARLRQLIMEGKYEAPVKGGSKTAIMGDVFDRILHGLEYLIPGNERDTVLALLVMRVQEPEKGIPIINKLCKLVDISDLSVLAKDRPAGKQFRGQTVLKQSDTKKETAKDNVSIREALAESLADDGEDGEDGTGE